MKTVAIGCMWCGLEESPGRVCIPCCGRVDVGTIFHALRQGVSGVLLLACPEGECHYRTGSRLASETVDSARSLARACGIRPERIVLREARRNTQDAEKAIEEFHRSIFALGPLRLREE
jgi:coenzyme F420-reducing hydrogenase delta subunit